MKRTVHEAGAAIGAALRAFAGGEAVAARAAVPSPVEMATARRLVFKAPHLKEGVEDLLWTLLNSREFLFNH